jgi:hypothetical protein
MKRNRGRPRKDINVGLVFHMAYNDAPVAIIAKHIGVHRDTIYANYRNDVEKGRELRRKVRSEEFEKWLPKFLEEKRLKAIARKKREKELRHSYYLKAKLKKTNFPNYSDYSVDTLSEKRGFLD